MYPLVHPHLCILLVHPHLCILLGVHQLKVPELALQVLELLCAALVLIGEAHVLLQTVNFIDTMEEVHKNE